MNTTTRASLSKSISHLIEYGDAQSVVMRTIQLLGTGNLPRDAREMSFAAQDYMNETKKKDRNSDAIIEHMLTAERRAEWPA